MPSRLRLARVSDGQEAPDDPGGDFNGHVERNPGTGGQYEMARVIFSATWTS
jgi:hypothetical protein